MIVGKEIERIESELKSAFERRRIFDMSDFKAEPLGEVRIGYIGIGFRGAKAVLRAEKIPNAKIAALCDLDGRKVSQVLGDISFPHKNGVKTYVGENSWRDLCEDKDIDLVYIATPWREHSKMASYAMLCGKHAAVEIPAAFTIAECVELVGAAEKTKRHCFQLSNCAYDSFELAVSNMAKEGVLGEVFHAEGAYIHEILSYVLNKENAKWRWLENFRSGNLYPQHAIMPLIKPLKINRGDSFDFLASVSSGDFSMGGMARKLALADGFYAAREGGFRGNINTSVIKTKNAKTIVLQHDVSSPRPYDRKFVLSAENYFVQKYPLPGKIAKGCDFLSESECLSLIGKYTPEFARLSMRDALKNEARFDMDYLMDWRLFGALSRGEKPDFNVYDLAVSSAIADLSVLSVLKGSMPVKIPSFNI